MATPQQPQPKGNPIPPASTSVAGVASTTPANLRTGGDVMPNRKPLVASSPGRRKFPED